MKLASADFPLTAIGNRVYARRWSSPILMAYDDEMAEEIALRLNREDQNWPSD